MIEIVDRMLQHLEHVLLPVALGADVGERPNRKPRIAPGAAERADLESQPARGTAAQAGDAHLFLEALAFARRLEQPVDRFRGVGVADEGALHRPHIVGVGRIDEIEIGRIGIDDVAVVIGDDSAFGGAVDDRLDQRIGRRRAGEAQQPAGKGEQRKHPDGGECRQEGENIRLGVIGADESDGRRRTDQERGHQQNENDTAAAAAARAAVDRGTHAVGRRFAGARPRDARICRRSPRIWAAP